MCADLDCAEAEVEWLDVHAEYVPVEREVQDAQLAAVRVRLPARAPRVVRDPLRPVAHRVAQILPHQAVRLVLHCAVNDTHLSVQSSDLENCTLIDND